MLSTAPRLAAAEAAPVPFDDQIAGRLQHGRIVVLGEQVDDAIANRICAQLLLLSQEDPKRDIVLFVNSPGGSVHAGMAIYDTMRFIPNDVATLAMGFAASMGQFLLCAGTPGKRYALPNARIMMHQPSGGLGGTAADIAVQAENLAYTKLTMQKLIAEHCGQSLETIAADQRRDRWFTAEQAKEYGFVDRVVRSVAELGGDAASGFGFEPATGSTGVTGATGTTGATGSKGGGGMSGQYTVPVVVERTPNGERSYDVFSRLLSERIVFLGTSIDDGVANVIMAQMLHLDHESSDLDINLYINSPGGSATGLTAIYDTMQFVRADVATVCLGQAGSGAAVLLAAGAPGKRTALQHSRVLLHQPSTQGQGEAADLEIQAAEVLRTRAEIEDILSHHTGQSVERLREDTDRDKYFTAAQAKEYGLVDGVITTRELAERGR